MKWTIAMCLVAAFLLTPIMAVCQDDSKATTTITTKTVDSKGMVKTASISNVPLGKHWKFGADIAFPPIQIRESLRENAKFDVVLAATVGGGISFIYYWINPLTGEEEEVFSFSPMSFFLTGSSTELSKDTDLAWGMTASFFGGKMITGAGCSFGNNTFEAENGEMKTISRWFWMLGFGMTFK